jgi:hypothetical protein
MRFHGAQTFRINPQADYVYGTDHDGFRKWKPDFSVALTGAFSPDNCLFYQWRPRLAGPGFISGEWVRVVNIPSVILLGSIRNPDNNLDYLWVPRLAGPGISGEWVLTTLYPPISVGRLNIDDDLYYNWVPRLSGVDISGEWQPVCV